MEKLLSQYFLLYIQHFGKIAAVEMGVVPGHGQGLVTGNFLHFQRTNVCHEKGGVQKMPPMVQGYSAFFPFLAAYTDPVKGVSGFLVHPVT